MEKLLVNDQSCLIKFLLNAYTANEGKSFYE